MKTKVTLYGKPMTEIRIGNAAFIREAHEARRTSVVLRVIKSSRDGIVFETQNTVYTLKYSNSYLRENGGLHT